jgi:hypothetical protein
MKSRFLRQLGLSFKSLGDDLLFKSLGDERMSPSNRCWESMNLTLWTTPPATQSTGTEYRD